MAFEKDKVSNPRGRPKGSRNKTPEQIRKTFSAFLEANIHRLQSAFDQLGAKDQLLFIERVAKLVLPPPLHPFENLTEEQLKDLIYKLKNREL